MDHQKILKSNQRTQQKPETAAAVVKQFPNKG
jgi:hypothetical protein